MDKKLKTLVERLERAIPNLNMKKEGHYIDVSETNYAPPCDLNWYEFIEELQKNGLEIRDKN